MTRTMLLASLLPVALLVACAADTESSEPNTTVQAPAAAEGSGATSDDTTGEEEDDLTAKPTFATTGPLVASSCGGCHAAFKTLAGIKADKTKMISMISAGVMPKGNPGFKSTANGKKVLKWLKTGADLK